MRNPKNITSQVIPITKNNYPKGEEIPAQGRDGKLGGYDGNIFEVMFLRFAAHHVILGLTHHLAIPGLTHHLAIPGLTPRSAHAVMFFTNIHLRPVSDTTILVG